MVFLGAKSHFCRILDFGRVVSKLRSGQKKATVRHHAARSREKQTKKISR